MIVLNEILDAARERRCHMSAVKSALEKAMDKMKEIEGLTPQEKEYLKEREKLKTLLSAFYRTELTKDEIWGKFKGLNARLLKEAQNHIAGSIRPGGAPEEFRQRKNGILAIEALKENPNTAAVENSLGAIEKLQREYREMKESAVKELRAAIEANPQMRARPVRTPDGRTVLQASLSVDEAVEIRMSEFLSEHEKSYEVAFERALERLGRELK